MAVKGGSGPRPAARRFLNCIETMLQTLPLPAVLRSQLPNGLLRLAGGFRLAQLRSKDGPAGPKHHGSEGRIPACQTSPCEVTRN